MSISQQALLFAIGIGLSLAAATMAFITGKVSGTESPYSITTTEEVQESLRPFGLKPFPIEQRYIRRHSVFAAVVTSGITLGLYVTIVMVIISIGNDGKSAPLGAYVLDTIVALAAGLGWGLGIPFCFASLGLAGTEDGVAYSHLTAKFFLVASLVTVAAFIAHAVAVGIIH